MNETQKEKICAQCGRPFSWRKKWARSWEQVKYCSQKCQKARPVDNEKKAILQLVEERGPSKTICPSEILSESEKQNKESMERVRQAARLLAHQNQIEILQKGRPINPHDFRGPIRLRLKTRPNNQQPGN